MRILVIAKKPPYPARDGEAIAIRQMIGGLRDAGNSVHLLYLNTEKHHAPEADVAASLQVSAQAIPLNTRATIPGAFSNLFSRDPYHARRFSAAIIRETLQQYLVSHPTDLIQCEGLYLLADALAVAGHIPVIYRSHNVEADIWSDLARNSRNPLKKWYYGLQAKRLESYEKQVLPLISACVPISLSDHTWYQQEAPKLRLQYCPTGIDLPPMSAAEPDPMAVYFIGGMDWMPNREGLLWFLRSAWPLVYRRYPAARLECAGRHAPEGLASMMPAGAVFRGEVPDATAFAADKSVCIVPLLSGGGMKIKIAEALAAGKPVITTAKGADGMPSGMEEHLVVADTAEAFADAVIYYLEHPDIARAKGAAGRQFMATHLDTRALGLQLTQFYQTLRQA